MKLSLISLASALVLAACGSSNSSTSKENDNKVPADPSVYAQTITSDELKEMLYIYASDEFEGRDTGEPGQKMAVNYLKDQYVAMGVPSAYGGDNYFQNVPLERQKYPEVALSVNNQSFENFEDYIILGNVQTQELDINTIVYAGYGIDAKNYSDYTDLDVKGKVVLVKAGEPKDENGNYVTSGDTKNTKWMNGRQEPASKRDAAMERGAKALIFVNQDLLEQYGPYFKQMQLSNNSGSLSLKEEKEDAAMVFMMVGKKMADAIAPNIMDADEPKTIDTQITVSLTSQSEQVASENVLAFIEGSEKPDEILVISAHLDHEGIKNGKVYNGADDDGSGTVAIVEIAEAFKAAQKDGHGPKRSVLFLHVTGEEKGLLGSKYYTDNDPVFPLKNTIANLNIDMIGRIDPEREGDRNYVYLIGSDKLSTELHNISEEVNNKYTNITLDYKFNDDNDPNRFYYRSDHYNFAKNNIPVIFYFNGTHADYHQPSDTADKIEYDLLENRARLVFYTAWELANRADRIIADKAETE
ncbi:M28 family peptidase [Subsaximicrobium wynnwilliamsii]|uniref:M28 family peptidase n=1 Tax=Subsaximicrobium wynnwilliamsii TaxID=291179 RepID=A0A5C6ZLC0_9FLAO|nr:M28 family peptidase [Subsaximicrobium wynnwilliamsii]TXD84784.1 M28 family peptidase [Subsaximicrobium wynnwilliamsii]TXD90455.1 M28 family peptidase [Subsaximicrobium wynnwilliamsii]TXE04931.1 M28 family peptidase [Subsaximicrobium wynnwilliamsii]